MTSVQEMHTTCEDSHCDELVAAAYLDAGWRIEQCLWSQHWYLDGESVDPEDLSEGITKRTPDDARAALTAYGERMKVEGAKAAHEEAFARGANWAQEKARVEGRLVVVDSPELAKLRADLAEAQAKIARLTEALDEKQDDGKNFWMKWTQKRLEINRAMFLRDAKLALAGDMRALRNRVELMEAEPVSLVLSSALQENADE